MKKRLVLCEELLLLALGGNQSPQKWQKDMALWIRMYHGRYVQILSGKILWGGCRRKSNSRLTRDLSQRRTESTAPASPAFVGGTEQRIVGSYPSFPPPDPLLLCGDAVDDEDGRRDKTMICRGIE